MPDNKRTLSLEQLELLLTLVYEDLQAKETGKGLSAEDFTAALKAKLEGIESGAQVNTIEGVHAAGQALTVDSNKRVNVPLMGGANASAAGTAGLVPAPASADRTKFLAGDGSWTAALTSHQDISGKANLASPEFTGTPKAPTAASGTNTTQIATTAFVTAAVASAIAGVTQISTQIVNSLPAQGEQGVIYFVSHPHGTGDAYDEYVWTGTAFEKIGHTDIDLSGYMQAADYPIITDAEVRAIIANAKA